MSLKKLLSKLGLTILLTTGLAITPVAFAEDVDEADMLDMIDDMPDMMEGMEFADDIGFPQDDDFKDDDFTVDDDFTMDDDSVMPMMDIYSPERLPFDVEELSSLLDEISQIFKTFEEQDTQMPAGLEDELNKVRDKATTILGMPIFQAIVNKDFYGLQDEFQNLLDQYGEDELNNTIETVSTFWGTWPWDVIERAWSNLQGYSFMDDTGTEIQATLEEITRGKEFIQSLKELDIKDKNIKNVIQQLYDLVVHAEKTLTAMQEKISDSAVEPEALQEYWDILDSIDAAATEKIERIADFFHKNPELAPDEFIDWSDENPFEEEDMTVEFRDYYSDIIDDEDFMNELTSQFEKTFLNEIMHAVNDQLMAELSNYFDDQTAKALITRIMDNIDIFGEDFGNDLLENQAYVLKQMDDFNLNIVSYKRDKIARLYERSKATVISDKYKEELANIWFDLKNIFETTSGKLDKAGKETVDNYLKRLEKLLEDIDHENIFGEKPVEFYDVQFEEDPWFYAPVMKVRHHGIVNGYRDENGLTGYFGPADNVTLAQALKMTMEAADYHAEPGTDERWYQVYLDRLDSLNLARLNSGTYEDWNAPALRRDIILMTNEIFGIQPEEYVEGTFPDITGKDPIASDAMASKRAGIFTGEGDTGNLNPDGNINRAGFAKVINVAMGYLENNQVVDKLEEFDKSL